MHFTKNDFKIDWFSGTGKGGQHRNKTQNCCRITHIETSISATCQESRSRYQNKKQAFRTLAHRLVAYYDSLQNEPEYSSDERIRTYSQYRNEVVDHVSGFRQRYTDVVDKGNIGDMIEARRKAMIGHEID